jgi:hypothetical protein
MEFEPLENQQQPVNFISAKGIMMGDSSSYTIKTKILCSNTTILNQICVEFEMNAQALLNFYMQDLRFHFSFTEIEVRKVRVKRDHIGLSDD